MAGIQTAMAAGLRGRDPLHDALIAGTATEAVLTHHGCRSLTSSPSSP
jgi:hypothetical protein